MSIRRLLRFFAAILLGAGFAVVAPSTPANAQLACTITGASASTVLGIPIAAGVRAYSGAIFMTTRDCLTGPKTVGGTFTPVGGTPATCAPIPNVFSEGATCSFTGSIGVTLTNVQVVVVAAGEAAGTGGADAAAGTCNHTMGGSCPPF